MADCLFDILYLVKGMQGNGGLFTVKVWPESKKTVSVKVAFFALQKPGKAGNINARLSCKLAEAYSAPAQKDLKIIA